MINRCKHPLEICKHMKVYGDKYLCPYKDCIIKNNFTKNTNQKEYYSNCLFEVIKAKIKHGKDVKIIHIKPKDNDVNCHHWMWHDLKDNNIYDWYQEYALKHWWDWVLHKGHIRIRPYSVYERWLKYKTWK